MYTFVKQVFLSIIVLMFIIKSVYPFRLFLSVAENWWIQVPNHSFVKKKKAISAQNTPVYPCF